MKRILACLAISLLLGITSLKATQAAPFSDSLFVTSSMLRAQLVYAPHTNEQVFLRRNDEKMRSVPLALGLSAVVPGLGQAYNKQWVKAIVGLGLEAAIITSSIVWDNKGRDLEDAFQQYAHAFWDPGRYATWLNDYSEFLQENFATPIDAAPIEIPTGIDFQQPGTWSEADWRTMNQFFGQIRAIEGDVIHPETGAAFSHKLPDFSEQQYYELIGKYFQFAPGWSDYGGGSETPWLNEDGTYSAYIDPELTGANGSKPNVSDRFLKYADDHAEANDYLRRASRVSALLLANHFLAAIDAAISAKLHNDRLTTRLQLTHNLDGTPLTMASIRFRF